MSNEIRLTQLMDTPIGQRIVRIELGDAMVALRFDPTDMTFEAAIGYPGPFGRFKASPKTKFFLAALLGNMGITLDDCKDALDEWQRQTGGERGMVWEKAR